MVLLVVNNIKCRFKISRPENYLTLVEELSQFNAIKKTGNIVILRTSIAVYMIFSGIYVNITGIKHIKKIKQCIIEFYELFGLSINKNSFVFTVDNISAHALLNVSDYDINTCALKIANEFDGLILKNILKFPSVSVRLTVGTIVLFRSKKVNIVGVKNFSQLLFLKYVLEKL